MLQACPTRVHHKSVLQKWRAEIAHLGTQCDRRFSPSRLRSGDAQSRRPCPSSALSPHVVVLFAAKAQVVVLRQAIRSGLSLVAAAKAVAVSGHTRAENKRKKSMCSNYFHVTSPFQALWKEVHIALALVCCEPLQPYSVPPIAPLSLQI